MGDGIVWAFVFVGFLFALVVAGALVEVWQKFRQRLIKRRWNNLRHF